jgi:TPR repeat protein
MERTASLHALSVIMVLSLALIACGRSDDVASLRDACEANADFEACNSLARLHFEGVGAAEDKDRAIVLFERACSGGYTDACSNLNTLAGLYETGAGVTKDSVRAADLYLKACHGGVAAACNR